MFWPNYSGRICGRAHELRENFNIYRRSLPCTWRTIDTFFFLIYCFLLCQQLHFLCAHFLVICFLLTFCVFFSFISSFPFFRWYARRRWNARCSWTLLPSSPSNIFICYFGQKTCSKLVVPPVNGELVINIKLKIVWPKFAERASKSRKSIRRHTCETEYLPRCAPSNRIEASTT